MFSVVCVNFVHDRIFQIKDDSPTANFMRIMRTLYSLANFTAKDDYLPFRLNEIIFKSLASDSLIFLAGIWADLKQDSVAVDQLTYTSLKQASAFFKANVSDNPRDFQCMIPAVIATLLSPNRLVRRAAIDCVEILSQISSAADNKGIYAYDEVYGKDSCESNGFLFVLY